jgi:hypothetical protein
MVKGYAQARTTRSYPLFILEKHKLGQPEAMKGYAHGEKAAQGQ